MQLDTITEPLIIPNYKVTHMVKNVEKSSHFIVARVETSSPVCSGFGNLHKGGIYSIGAIVVEDLPISGKLVFLHVSRRKVRCIEDGTIRVEGIVYSISK